MEEATGVIGVEKQENPSLLSVRALVDVSA